MLASDVLCFSWRDKTDLSMFSLATHSSRITGRHSAWLAQMWLLVAYNCSQPTDLECFILQAFSSVVLSVKSLSPLGLPVFTKLSLIPLCLCSIELEKTISWIQVISEEIDNSIYKPLFLLETKLKTCYRECSLLLNNVCVKHTKHPRITGKALPACSSLVV